MASQDKIVIDVEAQVTDNTAKGTQSSQRNISKIEQSMHKLAQQMRDLNGKSKIEVKATLKDTATKGLQNIAAAGKNIAGKVWTVTMKAKDLVTAPLRGIWKLISNPVTQVASFAGITLGAADTLNTYKDFEQGMAEVSAISGATGKQFDQLTEKAKEMGASTKFTASESAEAFKYMAMAGWKSEDMIGGIEGILNLAAASGEDLGTTSDIVTDALTAFGLQASDAGHFADVLAVASSNSNTNVAMMGETFKYAASMAGSLGYSIEDTAQMIGLMANSGIKASMAGTSLNSIMTRLSTDSGKAQTTLKSLGIEFFDSSGNARDLSDVMGELRKATATMNDEQKSLIAKSIAGTEAQKGLLAILNASEKDYNKLSDAINNADGTAASMADTMNNTLQGSLTLLQSALDGVKIAIGEKVTPYIKDLADLVTEHMPEIQSAVEGAMDVVTGKIDGVIARVKELTSSPEWEEAETLWEKIKLAWDKIVAEPFDEWWNGSGKGWLSGKANEIGEGIGTALNGGLMAILGIDVGGAVGEGADIGKSFGKGFLDGFDGKEVGEALAKAIKNGLKSLIKDAATLLPGGKKATLTSPLSAGLLALGGIKIGKAGYKAFQFGRGIYSGVKDIGGAIGETGLFQGAKAALAAGKGGKAAESALVFAQAGKAGKAVQLGAKIGTKVAGAGAKAVPLIGGAISLAEMGVDAYHGVKSAEEWNGSDSTGSKVAAGIGAFLGGTGKGVKGDEGPLRKAASVGSGALKGAGVGAAVGTMIGGPVGTAIGAGVGAVGGAIGSAVGGQNISKGISDAISAVEGFFTESIPQAVSEAGPAITGFFTETVPQKWNELLDGVEGFFTEDVPYAIGYAGGKIETFFTESVPQFFSQLWEGITGFFTETLPAGIETVGEALSTFFTETVPDFFSQLWDGIVTFFTETVPTAIETVGEALTTFFTETVPDFFSQLWDGIVTFFTQQIPAAVQSIGSSITGFFQSIKEKIRGFFSQARESASAGYAAGSGGGNGGVTAYRGAAPHAEGGIMTSPHIGLVAEDGAEAIIPLSGKRRERGLSIWERAGQMLGVRPHAEGGIFGQTEVPEQERMSDSYGEPESGSGDAGSYAPPGNLSVTVDNISFEVNIDGAGQNPQAIADAIRENIRNMKDDIAYQLATALQQAYANTPTAAWEG